MGFQFIPATGLLDTATYPATPANETAARQQFMDLFNQLRDEMNSGASSALGIQSMSRQAIINGNFDVWQRGTSFAINNLYTADRWHIGIIATTSPGTISRQAFISGQTAVPNNPKYFTRINPTGFTGCTFFVLEQSIEGVEVFSGGKATLTFWAKADTAQNISAQVIQSFGTGGSPSSAVAVTAVAKSVGTSWTKYSITFDVPSISGKTVGTNGDSSLKVVINLPQSGTYLLDIAQVQVCAGDVGLPFQPRSFAEELQLCQRYYEKSYNQDTAPGNTSTFGIEFKTLPSNTIAVSQGYGNTRFKVRKRVSPTVTIYPYTTPANTGRVSDPNFVDLGPSTGGTVYVGTESFLAYNASGSTATTAVNAVIYHWTADAEL